MSSQQPETDISSTLLTQRLHLTHVHPQHSHPPAAAVATTPVSKHPFVLHMNADVLGPTSHAKHAVPFPTLQQITQCASTLCTNTPRILLQDTDSTQSF